LQGRDDPGHPGPEADFDQLRRTGEPLHADGAPPVHAAHQWPLKEAGEPLRRAGHLLHALQLRPDSFDHPLLPRDEGRRHVSPVVYCRDREPSPRRSSEEARTLQEAGGVRGQFQKGPVPTWGRRCPTWGRGALLGEDAAPLGRGFPYWGEALPTEPTEPAMRVRSRKRSTLTRQSSCLTVSKSAPASTLSATRTCGRTRGSCARP